MVVKSATKKKLMDLQIDEEYAHKLADDRKWDDVKILTPGQIAQICGIDSGTAQRISDLMAASSKSARSAAASTEKTVVRRKSAAARRRRKSMLPLEGFDDEFKMGQILRDVDHEDDIYQQLHSASVNANVSLTPRMLMDLTEGIRARGFNPSKIVFTEERLLVQGPKFKYGDNKNDDKYMAYQYIKILPTENILEKE